MTGNLNLDWLWYSQPVLFYTSWFDEKPEVTLYAAINTSHAWSHLGCHAQTLETLLFQIKKQPIFRSAVFSKWHLIYRRWREQLIRRVKWRGIWQYDVEMRSSVSQRWRRRGAATKKGERRMNANKTEGRKGRNCARERRRARQESRNREAGNFLTMPRARKPSLLGWSSVFATTYTTKTWNMYHTVYMLDYSSACISQEISILVWWNMVKLTNILSRSIHKDLYGCTSSRHGYLRHPRGCF